MAGRLQHHGGTCYLGPETCEAAFVSPSSKKYQVLTQCVGPEYLRQFSTYVEEYNTRVEQQAANAVGGVDDDEEEEVKWAPPDSTHYSCPHRRFFHAACAGYDPAKSLHHVRASWKSKDARPRTCSFSMSQFTVSAPTVARNSRATAATTPTCPTVYRAPPANATACPKSTQPRLLSRLLLSRC